MKSPTTENQMNLNKTEKTYTIVAGETDRLISHGGMLIGLIKAIFSVTLLIYFGLLVSGAAFRAHNVYRLTYNSWQNEVMVAKETWSKVCAIEVARSERLITDACQKAAKVMDKSFYDEAKVKLFEDHIQWLTKDSTIGNMIVSYLEWRWTVAVLYIGVTVIILWTFKSLVHSSCYGVIDYVKSMFSHNSVLPMSQKKRE
jgi:hypothetical protein